MPLRGPLEHRLRQGLFGWRAARGRCRESSRPASASRSFRLDSRGEAATTMAATRRLIQTEGMVAILGSVQAFRRWSRRSGELQRHAAVVERGLRGRHRRGRTLGVPRRAAAARAARASAELAIRDLKRRRAAVLFPDEGDGQALALAFGDRLGSLGGEVVFSEAYAPGTTDFVPLARQVAAATPEVLYVPGSADDLVLLVPALAFQGVTAQLIGSEDLGMPRVLEAEASISKARWYRRRRGWHRRDAGVRAAYTVKVCRPRRTSRPPVGWAHGVLDVLGQATAANREAVQAGLERVAPPPEPPHRDVSSSCAAKRLQPFGVPDRGGEARSGTRCLSGWREPRRTRVVSLPLTSTRTSDGGMRCRHEDASPARPHRNGTHRLHSPVQSRHHPNQRGRRPRRLPPSPKIGGRCAGFRIEADANASRDRRGAGALGRHARRGCDR